MTRYAKRRDKRGHYQRGGTRQITLYVDSIRRLHLFQQFLSYHMERDPNDRLSRNDVIDLALDALQEAVKEKGYDDAGRLDRPPSTPPVD